MLKTLFAGIGNYRIEKNKNNTEYYYFNHRIAIVDENKKTFKLDACGYGGYRSTVRALNDLERYYKNRGYELIERV